MKLFYYPGACSLAVHIALREAGLPFDLVHVDLARHEVMGGKPFSSVNSKNYVPALETDDGDLLTEVGAILQWVAEQAPERLLLPVAGTRDLRRAREWLNFVATELHKTFSPWLWSNETEKATREQVIKKLNARFELLETHLSSRDYLLDDGFSVADAYLFTILKWADFLQVDLVAYPAIRSYISRVAARPAVTEALVAEGLLKAEAA